MFCQYCGKEIADDSIFCRHCGRQLKGAEKQSTKKSSAPAGRKTASGAVGEFWQNYKNSLICTAVFLVVWIGIIVIAAG